MNALNALFTISQSKDTHSLRDRDFGAIKRMVKKVDCIYSPEEYAESILKASKNTRITVQKVSPEIMFSFKSWWPR